MAERMIGIRVSIARHVSDDQPGFVECEFVDARGQFHQFIEKVPIVTSSLIDATSTYPRPGVIACRIVEQVPDSILTVDTVEPWHVETTNQVSRFEVSRDQLIEWDWGAEF